MTKTTPVKVSLLVPQALVASVCRRSDEQQGPAGESGYLELMVLPEAGPVKFPGIQEVSQGQGISQETATANDHYLVSKTRLYMKRHCSTSDEDWAEVQLFDQWSFEKKLIYSREKDAWELRKASERQERVQDPLQD